MHETNSQKRLKISILTILFTFTLMCFMVISSNVSSLSYFVFGANEVIHSLTLDSSNKVTSAGDHIMKTRENNNVTFTYTSVASSTSGHVTLNNGGTIVNKDHIRGITSFTAVFNTENALKFRVSYDGSTVNGETTMVSGYTYNLGTEPYYLHLSATANVTITSLNIVYSCIENPNAHENEEVGDGLLGVIDFWDSSNVSDTGTSTLVNTTYVTARSFDTDNTSTHQSATLVSSVSASYTYQDRYGGIGLSSGKNAASFTLNLADNVEPTSVVVIAGTQDTSSKSLSLNDSAKTVSATSTGITTLDDMNELTWTFESAQSSLVFTAAKSSKLAIFRIYLYGETGPTIEAPEEEIIGFSATDSKASTYNQDSIYDTDNGLNVRANKTGGTSITLSKGGEDGYSYVVKNSSGNTIDSSKAFGTEGTYTVIVSYKNYIPVEIPLTVTYLVKLTGISVNSTTLSFNTAQKLSDFTNGITADLRYNQSSQNEVGVAYSNFASKNITLTLSNPSGVVTPITNVFGVAGTWTIKVASTSDASVYGTLEITVNAIPVETISVTGASASIEEGKTLQLTASVGPETATNKTVTWTSNHDSIATVTNSGLVTGVSAGEAKITATANDGSAVFGYIDITVTAKVAGADEGTFILSEGNFTIGSYVVFTKPVSDGDSHAMSKTQNANNRPAVEVEVNNSTLERDANSSFAAFRVEEGTTSGSYAFYDENAQGYLYAAGGGNYLRTQATKNENASFTVTGSAEKTITSLGSVTQNLLRWNSTSTLFSCYGSNSSIKAEPYIFEKTGDPVYPTAISLSGESTVGVGSTITLSVGYTPNETTVKSVTWESSNDTIASVENGVVTGIKSGTVTITAKAVGENSTTITATKSITVNNIAVTGVSLNKSNTSLSVGETETLVAAIAPANATNKNVTWSTSDNSVATVDNGVITAVGAGSATITVKTNDGNKTATCAVTVTASGGSSESTYTISYTDLQSGSYPQSEVSGSSAGTGNSTINYKYYYIYQNASKIQSKAEKGYLYNTDSLSLISISLSNVSGSFVVYGGNNEHPTSNTIAPSNGVYDLSGYSYFTIANTSKNAAYCTSITISTGALVETDPTSIAVTPSSFELAQNGSKTLSVTYTPSNANHNKAVTWTSSNTSVATVDTSGKVTVASNATIGGTATITARLTNLTSIYATATVTVVDTPIADHTVLIYICGADLESNSSNRLATGDIQEMLSVSGQPDDVNVVIETGGANSWASTYSISSTYLQRHHVSNKKLVTDQGSITYASMGLQSTLQSFIEYGIENFPASRYGLILWNHGGGMQGVCYDEKKSDDSLLDYEVKNAVNGALSNKGMSGQKLEWIGYDACLMQVQDIAEMNSAYANYMIASEESEAGYGWDYDTWFDDLYAKKTTTTILKAIVDGFVSDNGGTSSSSNDQTLSYLDLSYASAYKTAWENMASQLSSKLTSNNKSSFNNLVKGCKYYADSDYTYFGLFDAKDFINKLAANSTFNPGSTYTNAVLTAHGNLVAYSSCGKGAGNSYGLAMFWAVSSNCYKSVYYSTSHTNFSNWRSLVSTYGS